MLKRGSELPLWLAPLRRSSIDGAAVSASGGVSCFDDEIVGRAADLLLLEFLQRILCPAPGDRTIAQGQKSGLQSSEVEYQCGHRAGKKKQRRVSHQAAG